LQGLKRDEKSRKTWRKETIRSISKLDKSNKKKIGNEKWRSPSAKRRKQRDEKKQFERKAASEISEKITFGCTKR